MHCIAIALDDTVKPGGCFSHGASPLRASLPLFFLFIRHRTGIKEWGSRILHSDCVILALGLRGPVISVSIWLHRLGTCCFCSSCVPRRAYVHNDKRRGVGGKSLCMSLYTNVHAVDYPVHEVKWVLKDSWVFNGKKTEGRHETDIGFCQTLLLSFSTLLILLLYFRSISSLSHFHLLISADFSIVFTSDYTSVLKSPIIISIRSRSSDGGGHIANTQCLVPRHTVICSICSAKIALVQL